MRARLVEATISSIAQDGLAGASIEKITRRAGVSRGLVRHYFGAKSNLLAEAFQKLAQDYREMLGMDQSDSLESDRAAELRLRRSILPMFDRLAPAPDRQYAWFGFWALARSEPQIELLNHALYEEIVAYLGGQIADVAARRGREVDAAAMGRGLAAMMEGAWVHNIIGVEGMTVPEAQRLSLDYVARLLGGELASESH
ncbi:MAG TPA: TetR family transcriptional regulator C-terminal domain-containing protein [Thermoleophilia bacterium]|nr:TetR family transcriptional regulator C-terminal domain-containing protein [Thermoleophilia bacterium]